MLCASCVVKKKKKDAIDRCGAYNSLCIPGIYDVEIEMQRPRIRHYTSLFLS